MSKTRVAIIGLGAIAFEHLARLVTRDDVEVVGLCDLSPTLTRAMSERFGVKATDTDALSLLDAVAPHAVHVLTPPASHRDLVIAALQREAHVLVEKPAAVSLSEWEEMRGTAVGARRMLVENFNYLFTPALRAISEEVGPTGRLGDLVGVDVAYTGVMGGSYEDTHVRHFAHGLPGGALRNFITHPVSIVVGLLGAPDEVHAVRLRLDPAFPSDDECRVLLRMPSGWATVGVSRQQRPARFTVSLEGNRGRAEVDLYGDRFVVLPGTSSAVAGAARDGLGRLRGAATLVGRTLRGRRDTYAGLEELLDGFYHAIHHGDPPPVALEHIDLVERTVDAVLRKSELTCV